MTTLDLSPGEAESLARVLNSSLSQLHDEIAHTDDRAFRDGLREEQARIQAILERLQARTPSGDD